MPPSAPNLVCSLRLTGPDHRSPTIRLGEVSGDVIASIPTSEAAPELPFPDQSVGSILALDILEHVHDEQTWFAEFARVLMRSGELSVRVPLENPLAWLDALNIYRYISDTSGRGNHLMETFPIGWHRHYAPRDVPAILELAGFEVAESKGEGFPVGETTYLASLVVGNLILRRPGTEQRLFDAKSRPHALGRLPVPTAVAARLTVRARLCHPGFDPEPNLDESDRPEEQSATPLE